MPMPAVLTATGTSVVYWTPDWMQTPFNLGMSLAVTTAGTCTVDGTFSNIQTSTIEANGVGPTGATWFPIIGLGNVAATASYTTPIQALRLNMVTANATGQMVLTVIQATGPTW